METPQNDLIELPKEIATTRSVDAITFKASKVLRLYSKDLFKDHYEVEIEHDGRIYRLRLTKQSKLILTA